MSAAVDYFAVIAASAAKYSADIAELGRLETAARTAGLSPMQAWRGLCTDFVEAEAADKSRCEAAAEKFGVNLLAAKQ
jgi:hypothetical protein